MTNLEIGLWSFPLLLLLIFLRLPIGLAMLLCGLGGSWIVFGNVTPVLAKLKNETYSTFSGYSLSIIPLFLLMGQFATLGGMSRALFKAAETWMGHRRGGVAMAAVGACAGFGAICGSSLATAATMSQVALPELRRYGYSGALATGTLAAGGTLGILIPPSVILVIYAILTEQNIAKLFVAALVPGVLAAVGYMLAISIYVRLWPDSAGTRERAPYSERMRALLDVWPVLIVFLAVVGGIYLGVFTPTEGAAVGAAGTGLIALINGGLTRETFVESILATATATAMIFFIVLGAGFYNSFLALAQVPQQMAAFVSEQGYSPWMVLTLILLLYLVFGCVMDSLSMILLTIPIFFPIVTVLDFGLGAEEFAIWFGILVLIVVEVGLITPPVGMNLFVLNSMARDTPISATYRGVLPFVMSDILRVALLTLFPAISLFMLRWLY
ncbi:TRAP transporter large permease [Nitratireductor aquimarinus]|uniref:TRAP transporter large permease protein n=1 Tax=Nitratireductor aquimarinus TaxID=889300 RepID=A0ABU4ANQ2_9HYPH|nr:MULTISPECIES: TRAP transporter large permease [Nitratireductor]MBN7763242.1 TRAP transporter large permease [Nitratireductor aquibiodomus]MBN7776044.1 TRAP transporter large permease [Nitratireductor pacificus]MBN7780708.1 TRAP transporter large permease [Nitratireductor pacificus]MBN7789514.1 TRAP transporter large permease [Nitratireductor aquimarinus]MBN8242245.1 TRAP transporter large permease [Nitratireductor aquimarinus]